MTPPPSVRVAAAQKRDWRWLLLRDTWRRLWATEAEREAQRQEVDRG